MTQDSVYLVSDLREIEGKAAAAALMDRAGLAAAEVAREMLGGRGSRVLVLAGPGNNGGDAFVVARWLKSWFFDVAVVFHGEPARLGRDAKAALDAYLAAGGSVEREWPQREGFGLIVDGLFGIGLTRPIEGECARWIARANSSGAPVLALDVPSGLNADTGVAHAPTILAAATATFIALKPGLLTADGPDYCGNVSLHPLDLDAEKLLTPRGVRLCWRSVSHALPEVLMRAKRNVHKGSFGTLAIVGGNDGMVGAAILAGRAAVQLGAGKVWVGLVAGNRPSLDVLQPELMLREADGVLDDHPSALVVGPGLGRDDRARGLLAKSLRLEIPLVLDADALTLIAGDSSLGADLASRGAATLITPHPGEAAHLAATTSTAIQSDRMRAALNLAQRYRAEVVLKGCGSVIASPDGSFAINASGGAALASGGTGDVLSGIVGAMLAQGIPVQHAARIGVCLHGAAADALVEAGIGPLGLAASEIAPTARRLVNAARG